MPNLAFLLEYNGAAFAGWQRQREGQRTVQAALDAALRPLCKTPPRCVGAGRTDAGVHAMGQVASAHCDTALSSAELWRALNALLPDDLAVRALARVPASFHALRDAKGKRYAYRLWAGTARSPLRTATHPRTPRPLDELDLDGMRRAAAHFLGTHDFTSLQGAGSDPATTVRTLHRIDLRVLADGGLCLEVEGGGFLRHMVRNLAGTLVEVGTGQRSAASIPALLAARDRAQAGATAPAHGLVLAEVRYDPPVPWELGDTEPLRLL